MPMVNGYSVYVAPVRDQRGGGWVVRAYRDSDDTHIHSAEGGVPLDVGLREASDAIARDFAGLNQEPKA